MSNLSNIVSHKEFREALERLSKEKEGVIYFSIPNKENLALVLGYANGFDPDENDKYSDGEYHICGKIAKNTSSLQCDYESDWEFLVDEDGEIIDTEIPIYENNEAIAYKYFDEFDI